MIFNCPGAKNFRQPHPEIMKCPHCSREVEIWTDELQTPCAHCQGKVTRPEAPGCLEWCSYAQECIGGEAYNQYMHNKALTIKEKLTEELKDYFGSDKKRINHALKVMGFAEEILAHEEGDWHIVIPASLLHDVGIKVAQEKYGSTEAKYQEQEGPLIARKLLLKLGLQVKDIQEICEIIAHHHHPPEEISLNFSILYDADWLVNFKEVAPKKTSAQIQEISSQHLLTSTGKQIARRIYGKDKN